MPGLTLSPLLVVLCRLCYHNSIMPVFQAPLLLLLQSAPSPSPTAVGAGAENIVLSLLYQLLMILAVTRIVTWAVQYLGQTDVSGEILAGLLLGPSFLQSGLFGSHVQHFIQGLFAPSTAIVFAALAQLGLILLMFQIGLEFEFLTHLGTDKRSIFVISIIGILLPFVMGYGAAPWFHARMNAPEIPLFGFRMFFAVAMSITAIPILGRIFMELGLSHTRTAALTIGAAAVDDVMGWLILGAISLLVKGAFTWAWALPRILGLAFYLLATFFVVRPILKRAVARHLEHHGGMNLKLVPVMLLILFASATITSNLGVFAIVGGFVIGVALHDDRVFVKQWKSRVGPIVQALFLPIFFAYTGLRTDLGTIEGWSGFRMLMLILAIAFVSKFGGAYIASLLVGESNRTALTIGVCMNTRALMELIVLNIGKDLGVLPTNIFSMLVIMAVVSTYMATPLIRWLMRAQRKFGPALGEPIRATAAVEMSFQARS
jgi:Kef-type K+ transport system membrane component KefB